MRLDELADLQPVRDPALREAYREQAELCFGLARELAQQNRHTESRELKRQGRYFWLVACGYAPREAEDLTDSKARVKRTREQPMPPDKLLQLPLREMLDQLDGAPDDPLRVIAQVWTMPEFVELASRFTEREWQVICLRDGYRLPSWRTSELLGCSVRTVEAIYAKARGKYGLAVEDYASLCRLTG